MKRKHLTGPSMLYATTPWRCEHDESTSRILMKVNGEWLFAASVPSLPHLYAREVAEMIVMVMNAGAGNEMMLAAARSLIEEFLQYGVNWSSESEAERWLEAFEQAGSAPTVRAS